MMYCLSRSSFSPTPLVLAIAAAYACVPAVYAKEGDPDKTLALRRFHTVDIRVAEAGAGTLA